MERSRKEDETHAEVLLQLTAAGTSCCAAASVAACAHYLYHMAANARAAMTQYKQAQTRAKLLARFLANERLEQAERSSAGARSVSGSRPVAV